MAFMVLTYIIGFGAGFCLLVYKILAYIPEGHYWSPNQGAVYK
jgi:hypothetical protein